MPSFVYNDTDLKTAFRGGSEGFVDGHYVIWAVAPSAIYEPDGKELTIRNWYAYRQKDVRFKYKHPSGKNNSTVQRLIKAMRQIAKNEAEKETKLISARLDKLKNRYGQNKPQTLQLAYQALQQGKLSEAYNWLMHYDKDVEELKREVRSSRFKNLGRMNQFFDTKFSKYFKSLFSDLKNRDRSNHYVIDPNLTPAQIIQDYISEHMQHNEQLMIMGMQDMYDKLRIGFEDILDQAGLADYVNKGFLSDPGDLDKLVEWVIKSSKKPNEKLRNATTKQKIDAIVRAIELHMANGMGTEIADAIAQKRITGKSGVTFLTGDMLKLISKWSGGQATVRQKEDTITFEALYDIDLTWVQEYLQKAFETGRQEAFVEAVDNLNKALAETGQPIFEVLTNIKGNTSKREMKIEEQGSFGQRTEKMRQLADAGALPGDVLNQLVFLLYNTMHDCIGESYQPQIKLYLGVACATWMFDEYVDVYLPEHQGVQAGINKVYIFSAGTQNYTLSDIISNVVDDIENYCENQELDNLFDIVIEPPSNAAAVLEYQQAINDNMIPMNQAREDEDEDQIQMLLQERWDRMRNWVATNGKMRISLDQDKITELLSTFESYLRYS